GEDPIVVYADRLTELKGAGRFWVQTSRTLAEKKSTLSYAEFVRTVKRLRIPLVFDTQHFLEYALSVYGVGRLPANSDRLYRVLEEGWQELKDLVMEIHLVNFNPELGSTRGRNVPLEEGVLPLRDFCQMVKKSGWEGTVVPEVSRLFWSSGDLRALREQVHGFFK
ncbi:MAG: TIM barrel protein, partial [Patescibacteria group bacterium]